MASNLPEGKYIKPPASAAKYYKVEQPCFEDKIQELNTDFAKVCISPKPSGDPLGKVPLQVLKELEHQARQNLSTINFTATFAKTASSCNTVMEKCQHSFKATFKRVKSQIKKGADPERAVRRGYENACDYFEILNKRILIQQRALACLSQSVAHILQRELYTMGNTGLLRRKAEITLLQPHLGDSRHQSLRNSSYKVPLYVSPVPDQNAWDIDALNINWSGLTAYANPPTALRLRVIQKNQAIQLSDHCNSPRLARDALVLRPSAALNRDPTSTTSVKNSSQTVPQVCVSQQSTTSQPPRLVSRSGQLQEQDFSVEVAEIIAHRSSTRTIYKSKWALFEKWCRENSQRFLHSLCKASLRLLYVPVPRSKQAPFDH